MNKPTMRIKLTSPIVPIDFMEIGLQTCPSNVVKRFLPLIKTEKFAGAKFAAMIEDGIAFYGESKELLSVLKV